MCYRTCKFVRYSEVFAIWSVRYSGVIKVWYVWYIAYCPLYGRCPLFGVSAKRGSTVIVKCDTSEAMLVVMSYFSSSCAQIL